MNDKKNFNIEKTFELAIQNHKKNNFQIAEKFYKEILEINSNHFASIFYLGTLLAQTKRLNLAKPMLFKAIQIQPNYADAHNNFGNILKELGEYKDALNSYEKAIQIQPNLASAHYNHGVVLEKLGEYKDAINSYEKAIQIQPNFAIAHYNYGVVLEKLGEYKDAINSYEKAIQIQPNLASAHYNLGLIQKELGEHQKAKNSYEKAVRYNPGNLVYLYHLSDLDEKILNSNLKNKIYEIIEKNNSSKKNIAYGNFLLSKYELNEKKYENELDYLLKGHQYYFESEEKKFKKGIEYWLNILPKRKELINLKEYYKNIEKENFSIKPIFIVGVPRCGSTLIEKVIASGNQYVPIGEETGIIHTVIQNIINNEQSSNPKTKNLLKEISVAYKNKGLVHKKSNYMFTDKSLENFFYIDIIQKIFPEAKIINCRRDALSSIISTLKNNQIFQAWAHNLENIFKYHDIYYRMIENFKKTMPNFIYDLEYEKFINNPEDESKKLMRFCGIPWDIKCLEFYKRKDLFSKTASNVQIRKAIYKDSINKYLPYKNFLIKNGKKYSWFNRQQTLS